MRIAKIIIVFMIIVNIWQGISFSAEDFKDGMNPNQPFSPGDSIDKISCYIKEANGGVNNFTIVYKTIEQNNVMIECISEIKGNANGADGVKTKVFKLPLDSNKQTFLNLLSQKNTFVLTVIDDKNRITLQKTKAHKNVPVRMYPDMMQGVAAHSADFDINAPLFGGGKNEPK